jgi:DNA-binding response OmpR family regulator
MLKQEMENTLRIVIVEDDASISASLEYCLNNEGFDVYPANTGKKAIALIHEKDPQILLLDIRLPDMNGFDLCKQIRAERRTFPILMLTALDEEADRVLGLELGADDYIVKPYKLRELVARIRSAARRAYGELSGGRDGRQFVFGDIRADFDTMQVYKGQMLVPLTPIELKLLKKLLNNPGRIFSRDDLINAIYGDREWICDQRTIDVHIAHIRDKLENEPKTPRYFITVHGFGYKFEQ